MSDNWENATIETLKRIDNEGPIAARFSDNGVDWIYGKLAGWIKSTWTCSACWIPENYDELIGLDDWAFQFCQVRPIEDSETG
jgi:hypothetical protein